MRVLLFDAVLDGHHLEYVQYIADYLLEHGDDVLFATWQRTPLLEQLDRKVPDLEIRFVRGRNRKHFGGNILRSSTQLLGALRRSTALANQEEVDVVHHLSLDRSELPLSLASRGRSTQKRWELFATLWWPYFVHAPSEEVPLLKRAFHEMNRRTLRNLMKQGELAGLFVHSERIKGLVSESHRAGTPTDRVFVVPDPVRESEPISPEVARARLELPLRRPLILFFGHLRSDKGPDIFLRSLTLLPGEWTAVVAGPPKGAGEWELAESRRVLPEDRLVTRLGRVSEDDVDLYFAAADVVVLPYRSTFKGTSGVLQRAASAGKPVVGTDVGDVGPTIRERRLGIVAQPDSPESLAHALEECLQDLSRIQADVESRAFDYARASDWRILGERVRSTYIWALHHAALRGSPRPDH